MISRVTNPLADSIADLFTNIQTTTGDLAGHTVKFLKNIPAHMQDRNVAVAVFVAANAAFFSLANLFANWLDKRLEKQDLKEDQKSFKNFLLNGVVIGGSTTLFNYTLSKATNYPLSHFALAGMTLTAIAARVLLNREVAAADEKEKTEEKEKTPGKESVPTPEKTQEEDTEGAVKTIACDKAILEAVEKKLADDKLAAANATKEAADKLAAAKLDTQTAQDGVNNLSDDATEEAKNEAGDKLAAAKLVEKQAEDDHTAAVTAEKALDETA